MNNAEHFDDAKTITENNHIDIKRRIHKNIALMYSLRKLNILPILHTLTFRTHVYFFQETQTTFLKVIIY